MNFISQNVFIFSYVLEVYDDHFVLPELGAIGANGLANPRQHHPPSPFKVTANNAGIS